MALPQPPIRQFGILGGQAPPIGPSRGLDPHPADEMCLAALPPLKHLRNSQREQTNIARAEPQKGEAVIQLWCFCLGGGREGVVANRSISIIRTAETIDMRSRHSRSIDDDNEPVWPTWAVGALFRSVRCIHINHVCFDIPPSLRSRDSGYLPSNLGKGLFAQGNSTGLTATM